MIRLIPPVFSKAVMIPIILTALAAKCFNPSATSEKNNKSNTARLLCIFSVEYVSQYLGLHRHLSLQKPDTEWGSLFTCSWKTLCPECKSCSGIRVCFTASNHAGMVLSASGSRMTTCFTAQLKTLSSQWSWFVFSIICLECKVMPVLWCLVPIVSNALTLVVWYYLQFNSILFAKLFVAIQAPSHCSRTLYLLSYLLT